MHLFHRWSNWRDVREVKGSFGIGSGLLQERECIVCGKKQRDCVSHGYAETEDESPL